MSKRNQGLINSQVAVAKNSPMTQYETINNLNLIENGLLHIRFELSRDEPSFFRVAREAHLVFYRAMIEALKGSANLAITSRPSKSHEHKYQIGDEPWKEIHKLPVTGCNVAWRFSEPAQCEPLIINYELQPDLPKRDDYLISFYDALAMVQADCFMRQFIYSKKVQVSDIDMQRLEWLHEDIRNGYEHFIPKSFSAPINDLVELTDVSLRLCRDLLESQMVIPSLLPSYRRLKELIENSIQQIQQLSNQRLPD